MTIGTKIRGLRLKKGYSQEYMAALLEISQSKYHNIESDKTTGIDFFLLLNVIKILGTSLTYFLPSDYSYLDRVSDPEAGNTVDEMPREKLLEDYLMHLKKHVEMVQQLMDRNEESITKLREENELLREAAGNRMVPFTIAYGDRPKNLNV